MKKVLFVLVFIVLGGTVFAGGSMDASMVSDDDVTRMERIVEALDPQVAIQTALTSFPNSSYPLNNYLETQKMRINRIFNEYGIEFSRYDSYEGLSPKAQTVFAKLKSRYSYLDTLSLKKPDELRSALALLQE